MARGATTRTGARGGEPAGGGERAAEAVTPMAIWVGRARAAGGVLGFLAALWVCHRQGLGLVDATLRALVAAAGLSLVAWWSALLVIKGLMDSAAAQREREREQAAAEAAAAREAAAATGQPPAADPAQGATAPNPEAG